MKKNLLFIAIISTFILAALLRLIGLGSLPDGVLPDEAYAAYNTYGLLTEGIDSRGYHFPVYFIAWGSGMSVLYSYIAIPFFQIFGVSIIAFRLPQALFGIAAVVAMYIIGKELYNKKIGLLFSFFLAINPWHIMNTRFALDANMAPNMFLLAFCFLILGIKRDKLRFYIAFALFSGLTLYCYAQSWIMIPIFIILAFFLYRKQLPKGIHLVAIASFLFIIALPLILFVGINIGLLDEIITPFFSIPKLHSFRGSELDIINFVNSLRDTLTVILSQKDYATHTYSSLVGAYYTVTTPFIIIGIVLHIKNLIRDIKKFPKNPDYLMLLWLISAGVICVLNENVTIIHINLIHIPIIFYSCYGAWQLAVLFKNRYFIPMTVVFLLGACSLFIQKYATEESSYFFNENAVEIIEAAKEKAGDDEKIIIVNYATIKYSNLLWIELPDVSKYHEAVIYTGDPAWQEIDSFEQFSYIASYEDATEDGIYIIHLPNREYFLNLGYEVETVNSAYALAYK